MDQLHQRQGIAPRLLAELAALAKSRRIDGLVAKSETEAGRSALSRAGFGDRFDEYGLPHRLDDGFVVLPLRDVPHRGF